MKIKPVQSQSDSSTDIAQGLPLCPVDSGKVIPLVRLGGLLFVEGRPSAATVAHDMANVWLQEQTNMSVGGVTLDLLHKRLAHTESGGSVHC